MYDQICISRHFKEFKVIDPMYSNVHFLLCVSVISYGFSVSMVSMIDVFVQTIIWRKITAIIIPIMTCKHRKLKSKMDVIMRFSQYPEHLVWSHNSCHIIRGTEESEISASCVLIAPMYFSGSPFTFNYHFSDIMY